MIPDDMLMKLLGWVHDTIGSQIKIHGIRHWNLLHELLLVMSTGYSSVFMVPYCSTSQSLQFGSSATYFLEG